MKRVRSERFESFSDSAEYLVSGDQRSIWPRFFDIKIKGFPDSDRKRVKVRLKIVRFARHNILNPIIKK